MRRWGRCPNVFWAPLPEDTFHFLSYEILYEGAATKIIEVDNNYPTIYTLTSAETTFVLSRKRERPLCGFNLIQTEHPRLVIVETTPDNPFATKKKILSENLEIRSLILTANSYMSKDIKTQMEKLYVNVVSQKCLLEQKVSKNTISLAHIRPDLFAYILMKGPGYIAVIAGEAAYVMKRVPVEVTRQNTRECYLELPINVNNATKFLLPKTSVIVESGTIVPCNPLVPTLYNIQRDWISLT